MFDNIIFDNNLCDILYYENILDKSHNNNDIQNNQYNIGNINNILHYHQNYYHYYDSLYNNHYDYDNFYNQTVKEDINEDIDQIVKQDNDQTVKEDIKINILEDNDQTVKQDNINEDSNKKEKLDKDELYNDKIMYKNMIIKYRYFYKNHKKYIILIDLLKPVMLSSNVARETKKIKNKNKCLYGIITKRMKNRIGVDYEGLFKFFQFKKKNKNNKEYYSYLLEKLDDM